MTVVKHMGHVPTDKTDRPITDVKILSAKAYTVSTD